MCNIDQTTSQITSVSSFQSSIGQTFTSTVSRDKILQHRQALFEVCQNRVFNNLSAFSTRFLRLRHQTTHTGQLTNLFLRTTSTGIQHHIYRIESLIIARQLLHQNIRQFRVYVSPSIDNLVITFIISNETHVIIGHDLLHFGITFVYQSFFFGWNNHVGKIKRQAAFKCHLIT